MINPGPNVSLKEHGYIVFNDYFEGSLVGELRDDLDFWLKYAAIIRKKNGLEEGMSNVAHHVLGRNDSMAKLIKLLPFDAILRRHFDGPYILNSFGGLSHNRGVGENESYNHVNKFHRDVRTYSSSLPLMVNVLIMLDDFNERNGATKALPLSHKIEEKPSQKIFDQNAIYFLGKAGTAVIFDSNLWHSATPNTTPLPRRALTLTFTRPFVKPQIDYCRLVGIEFSNDSRVLEVIGFKSRIPEGHEDWYQPSSKRFYFADQG
ncbi:MAG: phytanoyl-CoA dioxygenase family protein [Emcibacteraceae bacterium]|nr:phytanoyl-CoA dioxygenase family protein [Emcibacteraceae bacterium]